MYLYGGKNRQDLFLVVFADRNWQKHHSIKCMLTSKYKFIVIDTFIYILYVCLFSTVIIYTSIFHIRRLVWPTLGLILFCNDNVALLPISP